MDDARHQALLTEYAEVSANFRELTEIRFKLLAFLPIASGGAAAALTFGGVSVRTLGVSIFGLAVTIGLITYNVRNDQLYDDLVGRAAAIERTLGVPDGAFATRPTAWLNVPLFPKPHVRWSVDHRRGVATIYCASVALWLFGVIVTLGKLGRHARFRPFGLTDAWMQVVALALAVTLTLLSAWLLKKLRKRAECRLRCAAAEAVRFAKGRAVQELAHDIGFETRCAALGTMDRDDMEARIAFFKERDDASIAHYVGEGFSALDKMGAARFVAVIVDLSPRWVYDCATERREKLKCPPEGERRRAR